MAVLAVTNTLANGQTPDASLWNTNYDDIETWLNNRYNGTDTWLNMKVLGTSSNPAEVKSSNADCEFDIDSTGTNGTPRISWKRSGTTYFTFGVDGAASNVFKAGTTGLTTNVAFQLPTGGAQVQFANGSAGTPSISFINDATNGVFRAASGQIGYNATSAHLFYINGTEKIDVDTSTIFPATDNAISCGKTGKRWTEVWAANGSINTSHSSTKTDIVPITEIQIPPGVFFSRGKRRFVGYLNDDLPLEARGDTDGQYDLTSNYESSVTGMLCAGWWNHDARLKALEEKVAKING